MSAATRSRMIEQTELAYSRLGAAHAEIVRRRFPGALIVQHNTTLRRRPAARRAA